ncbi:hypothetical protein ACP4OV_011896 [Aristida adscensionis]
MACMIKYSSTRVPCMMHRPRRYISEPALTMSTAAMTTVSRKVCVVGAGMAGLAAARELRREGHAVAVMEQRGDVGGQWLYDPRADDADPLGAAAPVAVHSSMYASVRLLSPRECMGFSDFQFVPRRGGGGGDGGDARRFPGHREVYCYLKDFFHAFGLADVVRLNTRVVRVAMAPPPSEDGGGGGGGGCSGVRWQVRSVRVEPGSGEEVAVDEEVFDAVVVANGHYSQPRLPAIDGMEQWRRRQLHSHSYRVPEPFRGEVVVLVGSGDSGMDIALDLCGVAKEVHLTARSVEAAMSTPAMSRMLANHGELRLRPQIDRVCEDGRVVFAGGGCVVADAVIYCTGYTYSFPFLDTGGVVTVDDNRVGQLFKHAFPPALAPSLSFVGIQRKVLVPWFFEAQGRWIARVLSGRATLPPPDEMLRAVDEYHRARELAGVPKSSSHDIGGVNREETYEFVAKYTDLPAMDGWKRELMASILRNMMEDRETFRDRDDDSDNVREGLKRWLCLAGARDQASDAAQV